jgi:hypothetical protein
MVVSSFVKVTGKAGIAGYPTFTTLHSHIKPAIQEDFA